MDSTSFSSSSYFSYFFLPWPSEHATPDTSIRCGQISGNRTMKLEFPENGWFPTPKTTGKRYLYLFLTSWKQPWNPEASCSVNHWHRLSPVRFVMSTSIQSITLTCFELTVSASSKNKQIGLEWLPCDMDRIYRSLTVSGSSCSALWNLPLSAIVIGFGSKCCARVSNDSFLET